MYSRRKLHWTYIMLADWRTIIICTCVRMEAVLSVCECAGVVYASNSWCNNYLHFKKREYLKDKVSLKQ